MKELSQTVVSMSLYSSPTKILNQIEKEVKVHWDKGWIFIKAEPDKLLESVRLYFERTISC